MCLILFAHRALPSRPFVLAANRDESFARPSAPAAWWTYEGVSIFGGQDLQKGGTWLGVTRAGRIAAVTNVRDVSRPPREGGASRGLLVLEALTSATPQSIDRERFSVYNLIAGDMTGTRELFYACEDAAPVVVEPGFHGMSNHRLDTPWPKVVRGVAALKTAADNTDAAALFSILADEQRASDAALPRTGVPLEIERALSPSFIRMPEAGYGTRCSTVVRCDAHGAIDFEEHTFDARGKVTGVVRERIEPPLAMR